MGPTRFPYGQAKGFVNNFNYRSTTANLITSGDTTPDVTTGELFYTNNTSNTVITHFDLQDYANRAANYEGKIITVFFLDDSTNLANAGNLYLAGTSTLNQTNASITLMHSRSGWYELERSVPSRSDVVTASAGTAASVTVDNATKLIIFTGVSAAQQIKAISGGYQGQVLTLTASNTGGITSYAMTGGNIVFAGTNAFALVTNNALQLQKIGSSWRHLSPGTANLIN